MASAVALGLGVGKDRVTAIAEQSARFLPRWAEYMERTTRAAQRRRFPSSGRRLDFAAHPTTELADEFKFAVSCLRLS